MQERVVSLEAAVSGGCTQLGSSTVSIVFILEIATEMAKTTAKERGKGPGKTKGRPVGKKGETSKD